MMEKLNGALTSIFDKIRKWGEDRNFYGEGGATVESQFVKLAEEMGELAGNIARGRNCEDDLGDMKVVLVHLEKLKDAERDEVQPTKIQAEFLQLAVEVGELAKRILRGEFYDSEILDISTTLSMIAALKGTTLDECVECSYNEIKDRKGKFINGSFIKEADL